MYQNKSLGSLMFMRPAKEKDGKPEPVVVKPGQPISNVPAWLAASEAWKLAVGRGDIVEITGAAIA